MQMKAILLGWLLYNEDNSSIAFSGSVQSGQINRILTVTEEELLRYLSDSAYHLTACLWQSTSANGF